MVPTKDPVFLFVSESFPEVIACQAILKHKFHIELAKSEKAALNFLERFEGKELITMMDFRLMKKNLKSSIQKFTNTWKFPFIAYFPEGHTDAMVADAFLGGATNVLKERIVNEAKFRSVIFETWSVLARDR